MPVIDYHAIDWQNLRDRSGAATFLLPGEASITSEEMRRRTAAYYRQIRGQMPARQYAARKALAEIKSLLAEGAEPTTADRAKAYRERRGI